MPTATKVKIRPLHDRILVKRLEEQEEQARRHHHPRHRQGEAPGGQGHRRRATARSTDDGKKHPPRRQGRRPHPLRQVLRHRGQDRRRGVPDHARGGRPRHPRVADRYQQPDETPELEEESSMPKQLMFDEEARAALLRGVNIMAAGRQGHAGPEGPQRRHRQEVRQPDHHQGRRDRRQGDRAQGPLREHGRPDGQGGRLQDLRRRR